jgi:hypothetical protein
MSFLRRPPRPKPAPGRQPETTRPRRAVVAGEQPTIAVMTMVRDEGPALRRWVEYYAGQVGLENLIVLDDNSSDGSTEGLECTVHHLPELPGRAGFENARMGLVSGIAQGLLWVYDFVAFVDADEFLVADPEKFRDLRQFIAERGDARVIAPMALNVVHCTAVEADLDPTRPIMDQRSYAKFVPLMCKPAIKSVPAAWRESSHGILAPYTVDPELFMLHLKFADRNVLRDMAEKRNAMVLADGRASGSSWAKGGDEMAELLDSFVSGIDLDTVEEFGRAKVQFSEMVVAEEGGLYRAPKQGQIQAMQQRRLWRIPRRLQGLL